MRDAYGTLWYTDSPDGTRVPVDPRTEFGPDWIGHTADEELDRLEPIGVRVSGITRKIFPCLVD